MDFPLGNKKFKVFPEKSTMFSWHTLKKTGNRCRRNHGFGSWKKHTSGCWKKPHESLFIAEIRIWAILKRWHMGYGHPSQNGNPYQIMATQLWTWYVIRLLILAHIFYVQMDEMFSFDEANWADVHIFYPAWWTYKKQWKMAIEIVDFPIKNGDFPLLC